MPKDLPANIILEKNKLANAKPWLVLSEITLTNDTVYRIARNNEDVVFTTTNYSDVGCVGHWKLNDDAATKVVVDSSGNVNGTSVQNTEDVNVAGQINGALSFDGVADFIDVPGTVGLLDPGGSYRIKAWIKTSDAGQQTIFSQGNSGTSGPFLSLDIGQGTAGKIRFVIRDASLNTIVVISDNSWNDGAWHFVEAVKEDSALSLYVDNTLRHAASGTVGTIVVDTGAIGVLRRTTDSLYFKGDIDNVMLYNIATETAGERAFLWNGGSGSEWVPATFTRFNFQLEPVRQTSKGEITNILFRVSNITRLIQSDLQDLNGGIGSTVKIMIVNTNLLQENFTELDMTFDVLACNSTNKWTEFELGAPSPLRQRFPLGKFLALHCNWRFETIECSYSRKTVDDVTLSNPVSVEITGHGFEADDEITLYTLTGVTGGLEGAYLIKAATDVDNVTIKTLAGVDVDGGDFGGSYTSGGEAGYTTCERTLTACRKRENSVRFGGVPGMRSGGIRVA